MYRYTAYGLNIASELRLPELTEATFTSEPQVTVRCTHVGAGTRSDADDATLLWATSADACVRYRGAATFRVVAGREIQIDPFEGADASTLRLLLLGPALAVLLHQRGFLVLHASAVDMHAGVVVFAANKGEGKSTLAAALHARGYPVVADDLVAIELNDATAVHVRVGYPQLKLSPEVLKHLGEEPEAFPRLHPDFDKRARRVEAIDRAPMLPVSRIYVMEDGEAEIIEVMSPQQRFVELVRHSYLAELLGPTGQSAAHFQQVVALAERVPVLRLRRRRDLSSLARLAQLIEADARTHR